MVLTRGSYNWRRASRSVLTARDLRSSYPPPLSYSKGVPGFACEQILVPVEVVKPSLNFSSPLPPYLLRETLAATLNRRKSKSTTGQAASN
jgi:hypothetical protein